MRRRAARDDVHLVTGRQHRGVGAVAHRRRDEVGGRPESRQQRVDPAAQLLRGRGVQAGLDAVQFGEPGQRRGHRGRQPHRPAVLADPGHGGGQLADRVVRVDLRAVPGAARGGEPQPRRAPLTGPDRVQPQPGPRVEGEGPRFADALGAALEQLRVVPHQVVGAEGGAVLLVRGEGQHDVAARAAALAGPGPDDRQHHRVHVLHVDRAAPPDHPVADLTGERVHRPVGGLGGHHVQMAVDQQGVGVRIRPGDAGHHVGAAGSRLDQPRLDARLGQPLGHVLRGGPLGAVPAAAVGGVDPDQLRGEADHLVQGHVVRGCLVRGHVVQGHAIQGRVLPGHLASSRPVHGRPLSHTAPPLPPRRGWSGP